MKHLPLTNGGFALVDDDDFDFLNQWKWRRDSQGYIVRHERIALHRVIVKPRRNQLVDHANGNPADNRRSNLRACSVAQNARNRARQNNNLCGAKGVVRRPGGKWGVNVHNLRGERRYIGQFDSEHVASLAYDINAVAIHRQFARPNNSVVLFGP